MFDPGPIILTLSLLVVGSILAAAVGKRVGAPLLLIFLVAGMLAGHEGPGGIRFDEAGMTHIWASAALAAILFDGGLRTRLPVLLAGLGPGLTLAVPGTLLTAVLTAPIAALVFDLGAAEALLIGAVVASTDSGGRLFAGVVGAAFAKTGWRRCLKSSPDSTMRSRSCWLSP